MKIYTAEIAEKLQKSLETIEVKSTGEFEVIASTDTTDRHGEIVKQDGWELENYNKNPIILIDHKYSVDAIVGKATNIRFENNKMIIRGVFADTPKAQEVRKLYDAGFLKSVSVGFIVKQYDESNRNIITRAELLELSFVPVPANPEAIDNLKTLGLSEKSIDFWTKTQKSFEEKVEEKMNAIYSELSEIKTLLTSKEVEKQNEQNEQSEEVKSEAKKITGEEFLDAFEKALNKFLKS